MFESKSGEIRIKQIPQGKIIYVYDLFKHLIFKFNSKNNCELSFRVENGIKDEAEGIVALKFDVWGKGKAKLQEFFLKNKAQDEQTRYVQYALTIDLVEFIELTNQLFITVNDTTVKIIPNNRIQGYINGLNSLRRSIDIIGKDLKLNNLDFNITEMDRIDRENNLGYEPFEIIYSFSINACEKIEVILAIFKIIDGFELKMSECDKFKYHFAVTQDNLCRLERVLNGRYPPNSSYRIQYTELVGIENKAIYNMVSE